MTNPQWTDLALGFVDPELNSGSQPHNSLSSPRNLERLLAPDFALLPGVGIPECLTYIYKDRVFADNYDKHYSNLYSKTVQSGIVVIITPIDKT